MFRSLWSALWIMVIAIIANSILRTWSQCELHWGALMRVVFDPSAFDEFTACTISTNVLLRGFQDHPTWFGLVFAAAYTALYTRFAAQWKYIVDLYNSQSSMAVSVNRSGLSGAGRKAWATWRAAFIVDVDNVHLATKELFSLVIMTHLNDTAVSSLYDEWNADPNAKDSASQRMREKIYGVHPSLRSRNLPLEEATVGQIIRSFGLLRECDKRATFLSGKIPNTNQAGTTALGLVSTNADDLRRTIVTYTNTTGSATQAIVDQLTAQVSALEDSSQALMVALKDQSYYEDLVEL